MIILALLGGGGFGIYKFFFQKKQPQKTVQTQKATINVDELDIKSVKKGQSVTATITSGVSEGDQVKTITRSSSSSDEKSDMKGGMDAPSGGGMHGGNKQGGGMPSGGKQ